VSSSPGLSHIRVRHINWTVPEYDVEDVYVAFHCYDPIYRGWIGELCGVLGVQRFEIKTTFF